MIIVEVKDKKKGIRKNIDIIAKSVQILGELSPSKGAKEGVTTSSQVTQTGGKESSKARVTGLSPGFAAPVSHGAIGGGGGAG